jgi:hypothetical protein
VYFLFVKIAAAVAILSDVIIPPIAFLPLLHQLAMPFEIETAVRIAAFFIENVVHGHLAFKAFMGFVHALEDVHGFIDVLHRFPFSVLKKT